MAPTTMSRHTTPRSGGRHVPHATRPLVHAALLCLMAACLSSTAPKSTGGGGGGGGTGSLTVTIKAPSGVTPTVVVAGPNNYAKTLNASETLTGLPTGAYTITARTGLTADSIVSIGYAGTVTGSPATLTANATATSTVTYAEPWSSSGVLWVANSGGYSVSAFSASQLRATGAPTPAVSIGNGTSSSPVQGMFAIAVDRTGGVWMADYSDTLYYYAAVQLAHTTNSAATLKLVSTALTGPTALAFDAPGNLWVGDQTGKLFEFTSAQLSAGGTTTPAITLKSSLGSISRPYQMSFDSHGDLWLANYGDSTVLGFTPSQLATSGEPVPTLGIINTTATSNALSLAFDAKGNLWVCNLTDTLAEYTPDQLTSIGSPTPAVTIVEPFSTLEEPGPIAFDNSGALWIADAQRSKLLRFMPGQLATSGAPAPSITISPVGSGVAASMALPYGMAFSPHAAGLPLN